MTNPFGDCNDEEYERFQTNSRRSTIRESNMNPFEDDDEDFIENTSDVSNSFQSLSVGSSRQISFSKQSLDSNPNSDAQSINSNNYIGAYTLGEGAVEKEGLLCPDCFEEFRQITDIIEHSEKFHSANSTNSKSSQLKGFFSKIKTKAQIVRPNFDQFESNDDKNFVSTFNPIEDWKLTMKPGPKRSHFKYFRQIRDIRVERFALETNKLLIRLDKLLRDYPFDGDSNERRSYEQSIVSWIDDNLVNLCPTCTIKFNIITRNKHHCRLCGAVMCTKCSKFITFEDAYKLVASILLKIDSKKQRFSVTPSGGANLLSKLAVASPIANDLISQFDSKLDSIRICYECEKLMLLRIEKIKKAETKPAIVELYNQLQNQIKNFDTQRSDFLTMAESISNGDPKYSQTDLQASKRSLTKTGEMLDLISRKIEVSGLLPAKQKAEMDPMEVQWQEPSQKQQNLQKNIRRGTILYLKRLQQAHSIAIQSVQQQ